MKRQRKPNRTEQEIQWWLEYGVDVWSRTIYLGAEDDDEGAELGPQTSKLFLKGWHLLTSGPRAAEPIQIVINCPGGAIEDGFAIYDTIRFTAETGVSVSALVTGEAQSMAAYVLQAATHRMMHPHAVLLIHEGSTGFNGQSRDLEKAAIHNKAVRHQIYKILSSRTSATENDWERLGVTDQIFTAERALEMGLIDEIV